MTSKATKTTVLMVAGMRDSACRQKLAEALKSISGVEDADVNLYRGCATILHEPHCESAELMRAVEKAGYAAEPVTGPARRTERSIPKKETVT